MHCFIISNKYPDLRDETCGEHACIEKDEECNNILVINDIDFSDYGLEEVLTLWIDKLAYAIAYKLNRTYYSEDKHKVLKEIEKAVYEYHPEIDKVVFKYNTDNNDYYINHQSYDNMDNFMFHYNLTWRDIVFDDRYVIVPAADCCGYSEILNEVKNYGYSDFEDIFSWSSNKVVNDTVSEED